MVSKEITRIETRLGPAGLGLLDGRAAHLWLPGLPPSRLNASMVTWADGAPLSETQNDLVERIAAYFDGKPVEFDDPVDLGGMTGFQREVLLTLRESVRWGQTLTYSELARLCGRPGAARAVGGAMARNPVPLIIPCHRVIRSDGALGGFSAESGVRLKKLMLEMEAAKNLQLK